MKKTDLVKEVAKRSGLTNKNADAAITAFVDTIIENVAKGEKIQIVGFGTFECRTRNARTGINPRTGDTIEISETKVPAFKAGKAFKSIVNE